MTDTIDGIHIPARIFGFMIKKNHLIYYSKLHYYPVDSVINTVVSKNRFIFSFLKLMIFFIIIYCTKEYCLRIDISTY